MRAGLLSDPGVIRFLNQKFVVTWVLIDELKDVVNQDNAFAQTLAARWQYPLDLMFLTRDGEFVSKLNSFKDLPQVHPDVGYHGNPADRFGRGTHEDAFFEHVHRFLREN